MGHDDPRLRWHWLHRVPPQDEACIDGRLFYKFRFELIAAFGRLFVGAIYSSTEPLTHRNILRIIEIAFKKINFVAY
jgi:hypothetical protein